MSTDLLERDLLREVDGEIRFDAGARGAYSTDASNYRQVPIGVVLPRSVEAGARAIAVCREHHVPVLSEAGLGVTAHPPDMPASWEGWEDSAVAPHRLGDYLRDLLSLFADHGYEKPALYGHFGHGCVHIRMPFRLKSGPGVARFPAVPAKRRRAGHVLRRIAVRRARRRPGARRTAPLHVRPRDRVRVRGGQGRVRSP
ncbi:FAD linked oxidases, C-terminal domain [Saccharopolyspora antimicrobica]|uniref:FAD linked oxidases, C-terminal domain n=1 Tax=Saccharopolyspora antimicrobica TaxID=455193 RepID=A0A1I4RVA1_9PSEU|nr:FAD-linked oxidase C-terminal domain-containing protein [Saccharopolyspora antimicrobica]SFM56004.1 FAD linked oxidases, C-terminal domain [Saccharopolyspora antimicrobica]